MEVYRVASFYKAFRLKPSGKNVLTMCMGTACHVRGARLLADQAVGQLGIKPGQAILLVQETLFDGEGLALGFSRNFFIPDFFRFHIIRR